MQRPPSTSIATPVIIEASSEARKQAALPRSSGVEKRPSGIVEDLALKDLVARGFDAETVRKVETLLYVSEWKRYQAAPGPRISTRAFWLDRRYPLGNRWRDEV